MKKNRIRFQSLKDLEKSIDVEQLISVFDMISGILFWIKNADGQFIHVNSYFIEHHDLQTKSDIIGMTDLDFSPAYIAEQFNNDDKRVMQGHIVNERLELNIMPNGEIAWFTTSKRPLIDKSGQVLGSYGISRHLAKTSNALAGMDAVQKPVEFIRNNYMNPICLEELADTVHLSISALERRFKKYLQKTPKQFLNEIRLENARKQLIESSAPIADIANECGFSDHSYFSRRFKALFGELPSKFREKHIENS